MARKFLWAIAVLTGLVIAGAFLWRLFGDDLVETAFTPSIPFAQSPAGEAADYEKDIGWVARPGMQPDPARWTPPGHRPAARPAAVAFHVPPTAFLSRTRWNAPLDDAETNERLDRFTRMQASVLNGVADVWVPRYRQATFGSFLVQQPAAVQALDLAFGDVEAAFAAFLRANPGNGPIILSGHSQGARHLMHLMRTLDPAVRARIVAVYAVGWPVALPDDLAAMGGIAACTAPAQVGCIASWQSFAGDGDLADAMAGFRAVPALDGRPLGARPMLCVNPLTGSRAAASADDNAGTLFEDGLQPRRVGARCSPDGLLLISPAPGDIGPFVLPGGNFHVYDIALFWANVRADVAARLAAFADTPAATAPVPAAPPTNLGALAGPAG